MTATLLLAAHPCSECLTTPRRVVTGRTAADIVRDCRRDHNHFVCHKGSIANLTVHCRGVHDAIGGSRAHSLASALGIPIAEVDPDHLEGTS